MTRIVTCCLAGLVACGGVPASSPGDETFKWIGTDGGCGPSGGASNCFAIDGQYAQTWTYRIYVR